MTKPKMYRRVAMAAGAALIVSTAVVSAAAVSAATTASAKSTTLVGTFRISAGVGKTAKPTGSYFRMLDPGQKLNGPDTSYFANPSSTATDKTYTLLRSGTSGGLKTGAFQAAPNPAFDASGNSLAAKIIKPQAFAGLNFSVETQNPDPQTKTSVKAPSVTDTSGKLSGNLEALSASWHGLYFNQGSPKPGGSYPTPTTHVSGTYNATTHVYTLTWASLIVGGPFNGFTGQWILTGKFVAS
ncbi:MAG: hypothetical protein ABSC41_10245 [Acidimicrobiales bacterium]|jgi:hypothetical protein